MDTIVVWNFFFYSQLQPIGGIFLFKIGVRSLGLHSHALFLRAYYSFSCKIFFGGIFIRLKMRIVRQFPQYYYGVLGHRRNVCYARCVINLRTKFSRATFNRLMIWFVLGIMSYRVSSMYNHNNKIAVVLVAALVLEVSLVVLIQILTLGVHTRMYLSLLLVLIPYKSQKIILSWQPFLNQRLEFVSVHRIRFQAGCTQYGFLSSCLSFLCSSSPFTLLSSIISWFELCEKTILTPQIPSHIFSFGTA